MATTQPNLTTIDGVVDIITYANEENGYAILKVKVDKAKYGHCPFVSKSKGLYTIVGDLARVKIGEKVEVTGLLKHHQVYGYQIQVQQLKLLEPRGLTEIQDYLAKNVHLIGPKLAKAIVDRFGEETLAVIDNTPEKLLEIEGIGPQRHKEILEIWEEQRSFRRLLIFATTIGLSTTYLQRIYKQYGEEAIEKIKEDPYRLARDIWGIGFVKADEVAKHLGLQELSPLRIRAAAIHLMDQHAENDGDVFCYVPELVKETVEFLEHASITPEVVVKCLEEAVQQKILTLEDNRLYMPCMAATENQVADQLSTLASFPVPESFNIDREAVLNEIEAKIGMQLHPAQRQALLTSLRNKVSIITGGPGCGKTSILKVLVRMIDRTGLSVHLMAPTGRAAKRMAEAIERPASTLHRKLYSLELAVKQGMELEEVQLHGVVVCDEASMVDVKLLNWLLRYMAPDCILVLVGDKDQLPSVGAGAILRDLIASSCIPTTHLTHIFRQAEGSCIVRAAHAINKGLMPELNLLNRERGLPANTDMYVIQQEDGEKQAEAAVWCATVLAPHLGHDPLKDCQILAPMHKGAAGVAGLNMLLQRSLNPNPSASVDRGHGLRWGVGDRVMQMTNNYRLGVFNGDLGTITDINASEGRLKGLTVDFDGVLVDYISSEDWNQLQLAYAASIHKSQGSQYPMVVMLLHTSHWILCQRNLLYTGITRSRKTVVLIEHPMALTRAVENNATARRNTYLTEKLNQRTLALA